VSGRHPIIAADIDVRGNPGAGVERRAKSSGHRDVQSPEHRGDGARDSAQVALCRARTGRQGHDRQFGMIRGFPDGVHAALMNAAL